MQLDLKHEKKTLVWNDYNTFFWNRLSYENSNHQETSKVNVMESALG